MASAKEMLKSDRKSTDERVDTLSCLLIAERTLNSAGSLQLGLFF